MESLNFRALGSGPPVVLLHGFPFNQQIWKDFAEKLSEDVHVITLDLPGFGKSPLPSESFSLDDVAAQVLSWMDARALARPAVVGHSLGGYVALAMAARAADRLGGLCLFHSTALPDTEEKKASRDKALDFIARQGVRAYTSNFVSQLYADPRHHSITRVKNIAVQAETASVSGYLKAMRDRPDRTGVIKHFPGRLLFLAGERDAGIPSDSVLEQAHLNPESEAFVLPDVAHMGMFESASACAKKIVDFTKKCAVTIPG